MLLILVVVLDQLYDFLSKILEIIAGHIKGIVMIIKIKKSDFHKILPKSKSDVSQKLRISFSNLVKEYLHLL